MTTFDNTDLSAAASAIKPQLEIERLITTGAIYNPNTSKKERYEQQVIADRASNQLESIRRSVGHSGDTGRNTTSLRERYEQQLIADKAENQLRRAAAISKYQLRASLPQTTPSPTSPLQKKLSKSYSRKASDQHSVATAATAALSVYSSASTEYDLLDNSLFEGDGLSREELATAIEFGFVEYDDYDNENETPQHDDETQHLDKDEEYVSFTEGQARAKAKRMARSEAEEKKRMDDKEMKAKEEEKLRMEATKKKEQEEEKQRLAEAEVQAKKKKEREEEKRRIQERIANMESSKDKKDWQKTYKEWQMKYAR